MAEKLTYTNVHLKGDGIGTFPFGWASGASVIGNEKSIKLIWGFFGKKEIKFSEITSIGYSQGGNWWGYPNCPTEIITIAYREGGIGKKAFIRLVGIGAMKYSGEESAELIGGKYRRKHWSAKEGELDFKTYFKRFTTLPGQEYSKEEITGFAKRVELEKSTASIFSVAPYGALAFIVTYFALIVTGLSKSLGIIGAFGIPSLALILVTAIALKFNKPAN